MDRRTDDGRRPITIAHIEPSDQVILKLKFVEIVLVLSHN